MSYDMIFKDFDGKVHIIPTAFFIEVVEGKKSLMELEDHEKIIPVIVSEWLESSEGNECN